MLPHTWRWSSRPVCEEERCSGSKPDPSASSAGPCIPDQPCLWQLKPEQKHTRDSFGWDPILTVTQPDTVLPLYLIKIQHGGKRPALQQRGSDKADQLLQNVTTAQLPQRGRMSHRQRGQEAQRHLRHVHVAFGDERRQLGEHRVHHDGSHCGAEEQKDSS